MSDPIAIHIGQTPADDVTIVECSFIVRLVNRRKITNRMVQVKKAEVREAIVQAAARLFEEKGYVGTSIQEIGQAAGVASSGIYIYFNSKLELFYTIFGPWLKARLDRLDDELSLLNDQRAKVRHLVETIWLDIPNESNFFANNLMQAVSTATKADRYSGELLEWCEQRVARMLKTVAPRPRAAQSHYGSLAHILFMSFNGFVVGAYLRVRADKTAPAIEVMTNLIVGSPLTTLRSVPD